MPDYRSPADARAAEQMQQMQSQLAQALQARAQREQQGQMQQQAQQHDMAKLAELEAQGVRETGRNLSTARGIIKEDPDYDVNLGGGGSVGLKKNRREPNPLAMLMLSDRQNNALDRKVHQYADDFNKANLPQSINTLEDVNKKVPGGITSSEPLKSVGGWKNLVPGFAVGALEGVGIMGKGAADERSSLQNLANTQVYDQSGKAINESEMRRLKEAMGWSPFVPGSTTRDAIQRFGKVVADKGTVVEAGTNPQAKAIAQERGTPSIDRVKGMLNYAPSARGQAQPVSGLSPQDNARMQELLRKKAGR